MSTCHNLCCHHAYGQILPVFENVVNLFVFVSTWSFSSLVDFRQDYRDCTSTECIALALHVGAVGPCLRTEMKMNEGE